MPTITNEDFPLQASSISIQNFALNPSSCVWKIQLGLLQNQKIIFKKNPCSAVQINLTSLSLSVSR